LATSVTTTIAVWLLEWTIIHIDIASSFCCIFKILISCSKDVIVIPRVAKGFIGSIIITARVKTYAELVWRC
jgi:hypothetical protein